MKFPPLALLGPDGLRRRAASAAACLVALAAAVLCSLALFGLDLHRQYLAGLAEHAGTVMSGHNNQSLAAIASRLTSASAVNDWTPRPIGVLPATLALAASLALGGVALAAIACTRSDPRAIRLEAAMALALGIVAFPVAWDHYFVMLAPAMIGLAAGLHERGLLRRPAWSVPLGLAALVLALPTPTRLLEARTAGPLSGLLPSADGLAALVVFGVAAAPLASERRSAP